ncbi:unnamed protein product [Prunus armeniaca]
MAYDISQEYHGVCGFHVHPTCARGGSLLKKYGDSRTCCKSKSPLSGSGGKVNAGYETSNILQYVSEN